MKNMKLILRSAMLIGIMSSCIKDKMADDSKQSTADSIKMFTLGQVEQQHWDNYMKTENKLRRDDGISEDKIDRYMQSIIDEGILDKPVIFPQTENGTEERTVDYKTYKEYRKRHPIDIKRNFVYAIPEDLVGDSLQRDLINKLTKDSSNEMN
jgi:hypothetical protein